MKIKKTLALVAALTLVGSAFVGCGKDTGSSSSSSSSSDAGSSSSAASSEAPKNTLKTGGKTFTIMGWNDEFINFAKNYWLKDKPLPAGTTFKPLNNNCTGGEASAAYDKVFLQGADVDVFLTEADWALTYLDSDKSAPLSTAGLSDADFADAYKYTLDIARDSKGVLKGATWQCAPGGWAYRADLAKKYLGVNTPEEMQEKVKDWDTFAATAKEVSEKSNKKTALTTTLDGMWQVFSANRDKAWVVDGKLDVADSCKSFMELAKTMWTNGYVTKEKQWNGGWWAKGATDETMGYFVSTWGIGSVILEKAAGCTYDADGKMTAKGKTYGQWKLVTGPAGYFWGGTWICVSPNTDNGDLVESLIRYFTVDPTSMKNFATKQSEFVNNKKVMQEIVDAKTNKNENLGGQDQFAVFMQSADKIDLNGKITKYDSKVKAAFQTAYTDYCNGKTATADAAIEKFKDAVAADFSDIQVD